MRLRLLLIDDEELLLRALRRSLIRDNDVTTVSSGAAALALLEHDSGFDVILCDVTMPGMTGIDLYRTVERNHPDLAPRFHFLTGGAFADDVERFLDRMAARTLTKPVEMTRLTAFINAAAVRLGRVAVAAAVGP